jgi:hypothetical protein
VLWSARTDLGDDRVVDPVLARVREVASNDVRDTLTWLDHRGFQLAYSTGGGYAGFGDVLLLFTGPADVKIVRDRGQWDLTVRPKSDASYYSLAVLLAAHAGTDWEPPVEPDLSAQLPPGVSWREALPMVIEWLEQPGSVAAARLANARASEVWRQRLRRPPS